MGDSRGKEVISNIKENYRHLETSIVEQLYMVQKIHGAIPVTIPRGSLRIMEISSETCCCNSPKILLHSPAVVLKMSTANPT